MAPQLRHIVCPHCTVTNRVPAGRPATEAKCGNCHRPLFAGNPIQVDARSFERHLTRNDVPLVVDFWASWCAPCHAMAPAFERAAKDLEPDFRLLKVNTEETPDLAARYGIRSIPMLMMFNRGKLVAQSAGARDHSAIVEWVRSQGHAENA
jgi:thioredoxin 2